MWQIKLKDKYLEDESSCSTVTLKLREILEFVPSNANISVLVTVIHIKLAMRAWIDLTLTDYFRLDNTTITLGDMRENNEWWVFTHPVEPKKVKHTIIISLYR